MYWIRRPSRPYPDIFESATFSLWIRLSSTCIRIVLNPQLFLCGYGFRPHVSGYLWIRNFFFADTASVHIYPDSFESATFSLRIRLPSTWIRIVLNPQLFLCEYGFRPRVSGESGIRIRNFLNPLSRVENLESCRRLIRTFFYPVTWQDRTQLFTVNNVFNMATSFPGSLSYPSRDAYQYGVSIQSSTKVRKTFRQITQKLWTINTWDLDKLFIY